ncbi:hypothetical protein Q1695_008882 [Nippostrongylus brasiliensis]|nr:hypothetical protein Q1695_008882 [Nippostrongylus brasiliensis]
MPKQLASDKDAVSSAEAPATGTASTRHPDTFEVSTRLTLKLLSNAVSDIQTMITNVDRKLDTLLTYTAPRHSCLFCEGDNDDNHRSSNCPTFTDYCFSMNSASDFPLKFYAV